MGVPTKKQMDKALIARTGETLFRRLSGSSAAVCGLGGLGSNIAVNLARAGVGRLILIDFDRVDAGNLNRQQYKAAQVGMYKTRALAENLREISPYTDVVTHCVRLDNGNYDALLGDADVICEALDSAEEKSRLVGHILENMPEKTVVASSGMAGLGDPNAVRTRRITKNFYICGDGVSDTEMGQCLYSARVALCAAHQALTVLRIIAGEETMEINDRYEQR